MKQSIRSMFLIVLCFGLMMTPLDGWAKKKRRKAKKKPKAEISAEVLQVARGVYQDLGESPDLSVRLAITKGRIELGGEDREKALTQAFRVNDLSLKEAALNEILKNKKIHKSRVKEARSTLQKLLESDDLKKRELGQRLLKSHFNAKSQLKWTEKILKTGTPPARKEARQALIKKGGKRAWKLIKIGLKAPLGDGLHTEALDALKETPYGQAKKWALAHAGDSNADGEVARLWISKAQGRAAKQMTKTLIRQYRKAEGDFPRRVRLAHLLASRGEINVVVRTLEVAVKDKKGRVDEDLDSADLRVKGWEGLRKCRDHDILNGVKKMIIDIKNRVEAAPAVDWLADWVRDTRDPVAMQVLEDLVKQTQYVSRVEAIRALGSLKIRKSISQIEEPLVNGDEELRAVSAKALSEMATKGDEKRFDRYLRKEKSKRVREILLKGVTKIGTMEALPTLRYWLIKRDTPASSKLIILEGISRVKVNTKTLEQYLSTSMNDNDDQVRLKAWIMLFEAKSKKMNARRLKGAARWIERKHIAVLSQNKKIPSDLFISLALNADDDKVRFASIQVFIDRGESGAASLKKIEQESVEPTVATKALNAYIALKKGSDIGFYRKNIEHSADTVRASALDAIRAYGPKALTQTMRELIENERAPLPRVEATRAFVALSVKPEE